MNPMTIEIWSDIMCPWCYIGKRRFEAALERFAHKDEVKVVWRSFQLDPEAPRDGAESIDQMLARRKGIPLTQAKAMNDRVTEVAATEGLEYRFDRARYNNSLDAHRLIHLAAQHGLADEAEERLMRAYFTDGERIGDHETLISIAAEIGIPAEEARTMLSSDSLTDDVRRDIARARAFGISGVPFFAIDERYGISGAQSPEHILSALDQAWAESHPLQTIGTSGANCEDGSCDV